MKQVTYEKIVQIIAYYCQIINYFQESVVFQLIFAWTISLSPNVHSFSIIIQRPIAIDKTARKN